MVDGEGANDGPVFGAMTFSQAGLVGTQENIEQPVQLVFNVPMAASVKKAGPHTRLTKDKECPQHLPSHPSW